MSEGLNKVHLIGNLGADPELRMTQNGHAVLKLRIATTEYWWDKDQKKQERTDWHRVTMWGRRAEALARMLCTGSRIFVEGRMSTSSYEKEGQKHFSTEVIANNILLCGGKQPSSSASAGDVMFSSTNGNGHAASNGGFVKPPLPAVTSAETDIPF